MCVCLYGEGERVGGRWKWSVAAAVLYSLVLFKRHKYWTRHRSSSLNLLLLLCSCLYTLSDSHTHTLRWLARPIVCVCVDKGKERRKEITEQRLSHLSFLSVKERENKRK